ncbi:hypothetical protein QYE76_052984 [Lolium multiflorum]|uniref:Retrotransposon gag domain-containing protein n=1 Tax=Lolium multiflorum TaxID=4521 RepID=A0AAD8WM37_LOLMU|nr:hypothetical protein QYE76_052984 [Lolium multiflorum]
MLEESGRQRKRKKQMQQQECKMHHHHHPDFQQYMRSMEEDRRRYQESQNKNMQDFFAQVINDRGNEGRGVTLSDFQNARPLPFASAPEPMDAEDWLMDTERKLRTVGCNDEEKIRYATYLLSGPATSWWENVIAVHPPEKVFTWEEFKKKFRDAHVQESVVELKKREFEELQQNTAPIMQYVCDFNRLARYAPEEVNLDEKREKGFMKGMNPDMKMQLRLARTTEFQELIDSAITFEDDYKQVQEERRKSDAAPPIVDATPWPRSPPSGPTTQNPAIYVKVPTSTRTKREGTPMVQGRRKKKKKEGRGRRGGRRKASRSQARSDRAPDRTARSRARLTGS